MSEILITEFMDDAAVAALKANHEVHYDPGLADRPDEIASMIADSRALIVRNRTQVRGGLLAAAKGLQCVGRLGVGLDNIDLAACRDRSITVYPATGANNLSVAEYVITAALALLRGAWFATAEVAAGKWPRQNLMGRELAGKTLGLVGFGAIAQEVAWRAHSFGMQIVAYDPLLDADHPAWQFARNVSLDGVLELSDVVSLHVPLTDRTRNMIDGARLKQMKRDAILVNAARGGVLDEAALADALRDGAIGGAALDVFAVEPMTAEDGAKFSGLANVILTPHIAGVTAESNVRVSNVTANAVLKHLAGKA